MRRVITVISILATVKFGIQMIGNRNYGFHRDELLHLSVSEHLDWGFMEFPPFIGLLGKLSKVLFDYSLMGTRMFPTLAGVGVLVLCCLIARELRGNIYAILLSGICVLAFLPFYRNHSLFQPVAFDQLFWTLGFYYIVKFINSENHKYLLLTGAALGFGLLNKYTMLVWAFGVCIAMIWYNRGQLFKDKWWYLSGLLALLIVFPNLIWQLQNDWPLISHLQELENSQLSQINPWEFGIEQLNYPLTLIVSLLGVFFLLRYGSYRPIGIAAILIFSTMWLVNAKAYYVFALYPILFAAGSVQLTNLLANRHSVWNYVIAVLLLAPTVPAIPFATPVLSIVEFVKYTGAPMNADGRVELTGDYADMFGWEEQVRLVDSVYQSLTPLEQQNCVLWAENYGEAGALKILGKKYGLPNPISRHGSFWQWGYDNPDAKVWISIGNESDSVEHVFAETELVKMIHHKYAIDEENGIPLYICRKPQLDIEQWWANYEPYIFN